VLLGGGRMKGKIHIYICVIVDNAVIRAHIYIWNTHARTHTYTHQNT